MRCNAFYVNTWSPVAIPLSFKVGGYPHDPLNLSVA